MPGVSPYEPAARLAGTWRAWDDVKGKQAGVWKQADSVWLNRAGTWVKVWEFNTAPSAPTGLAVTVAYAAGWKATATWTLGAELDRANVIVEWSTNGGAWTPASPLAANATTATSPVAGGGSTIQARVRVLDTGGLYSSYTTSSTATMPPDPATGLAAALGATPGTVNLSWTNPVNGLYDNLYLARAITAGATTYYSLPNGTTTYADTPGESKQVTYTLVARAAAGDSPAVTANATTPPGTPTIVSFTATNPGALALDVTPLAHAGVAGYDVQLETAGVFGATVDTGADPDHSWTGAVHGTAYRARVRARDTLAQTGAWATSSAVTGVNDTAGPTVPTPTLAWNQTVPGFTITYAATSDALSGVATVMLQVLYAGGSWTDVGAVTATAGSTTHACPTARRGETVQYRLRATDNVGNATTGTAASIVARPLGTFYVAAADTATWETAAPASWRTDTNGVISGFFDGTYSTQTGAWFYGAGIANACKGYGPDSATILMIRNGSSGSSGINKIRPHANSSQPASTTALTLVGTEDNGPTLVGADDSASHPLPASYLTLMGAGTMLGMAAVDSGGYRSLVGIDLNIYSGLLTLVFN